MFNCEGANSEETSPPACTLLSVGQVILCSLFFFFFNLKFISQQEFGISLTYIKGYVL
jgi:hypothetical protein